MGIVDTISITCRALICRALLRNRRHDLAAIFSSSANLLEGHIYYRRFAISNEIVGKGFSRRRREIYDTYGRKRMGRGFVYPLDLDTMILAFHFAVA